MPAITTPPNALTTAARVKANLGITVTDHDAVINQYVAECSEFIENMCNRRFKRATYTQELYNGSYADGSAKNCLVLNAAPLVSISLPEYRTGLKSNPNWVTYPSDNYQEELAPAIINGRMPAGIQNIRATYVAGYLIDFTDPYNSTLHTLPAEISGLCERLVARRFKKRDSEGRTSDGFGGSTVTWGKLIEEADQSILSNYQRIIIS